MNVQQSLTLDRFLSKNAALSVNDEVSDKKGFSDCLFFDSNLASTTCWCCCRRALADLFLDALADLLVDACSSLRALSGRSRRPAT